MAKTQTVNYGNNIALPVVAAAVAHTPADGIDKLVNELWPNRVYGRRAAWIKNQGANVMSIIAPSGSVYKLDAGSTMQFPSPELLEDGAYTITGTAADTFSFWEAY